MRNSDHSTIAEFVPENPLNVFVRFPVQAARSLIEEHDFGLAEYDASQAKELLLSLRKVHRAKLGVKATTLLYEVP